MRRPVTVVVAQVLIAVMFLQISARVVLSLSRPASVLAPVRASSVFLLFSLTTATFLALAFFALWRRIRNAQFLGALAVVLFVVVSASSPASRALWGAFLGSGASTNLPAPYFNFNNRAELLGGVITSVVMYVALLSVAGILSRSARVRAFFACSAAPA